MYNDVYNVTIYRQLSEIDMINDHVSFEPDKINV